MSDARRSATAGAPGGERVAGGGEPGDERFLPVVDGLRALSILLVVAFHAFPGMVPAGHLGVDVFFVISGYLITGLVVRRSRDGSFSLADFYARRVRRLFPALLAVVASCLAFGWLALLPGEYEALGRHALAAAFFVPNVLSWSEAGYWDVAAGEKPLLHLWSLGVEEQFYLAWPLAAAWLARRRGSPMAWLALACVASLAAMLLAATRSPEAAFYLPPFRAWELLAGAAVWWATAGRAASAGHGAPVPVRPGLDREAGAWGADAGARGAIGALRLAVGLALVVLPALLGGGPGVVPPAWLPVPAVAGAALLLWAPEARGAARVVLANTPAVMLGRISYPLYLWHWPLLSFATVTESAAPGAAVAAGLMLLAFALAWLTWRFLEAPIRGLGGRRGVAALLASHVVVGAAGAAVLAAGGFPVRTRHLAEQMDAFEWESKGLFERDDCSRQLGLALRCFDNGRPRRVAVVGDSYSSNVFFALEEAHRADGAGVLRLGKAGCLPLRDVERWAGGARQACREVMNSALDFVERDPGILTVVLSLRSPLYTGSAGGNRLESPHVPAGSPPLVVIRDALDRTVGRLAAAGKKVVWVHDWPELPFDPRTCVDVRPLRFGPRRVAECRQPRTRVEDQGVALRTMAAEVMARHTGTSIWDPREALCDADWCWAMRDGVVLYRDSHHLSLAGSRYLGSRYRPPTP